MKNIPQSACLAVIETHPIQYHAPVYRMIERQFGIPVTVIYGSDFSIAGYRDSEFNATFSWDTDLLSGYSSRFLKASNTGGAKNAAEVSVRGLRKTLREVSPTAVLLTGYSPRFYAEAAITALRSGYPTMFRGETTDHARDRNPLHAWIRSSLLKRLYKRCRRLLYVGERSHRHFLRLGSPQEKLVFSPYCVDETAFRWQEHWRTELRSVGRLKLGLVDDVPVLLFSGKLSERKAPGLLLKAAEMLGNDLHQRLTIVFLGSGSLQEELHILARSLVYVTALFAGFQNQTQLSHYYHAADLLVLPSLHSETWGLVVNEALLHGLPCVVSEAVGSAPDLIDPGVTGEVSETGSVSKLASALGRGFRLVNREEIRRRCRERVSGYSVEKAAEGIARAFRELSLRVA